jgi:hypothetical protein
MGDSMTLPLEVLDDIADAVESIPYGSLLLTWSEKGTYVELPIQEKLRYPVSALDTDKGIS